MPIDKDYRYTDIIRAMRTHEAIDHYGTQQAVADALGIKQSSVAEWGEYPPDLRQLQIEILTGGRLKAEPECKPGHKKAVNA